MSRIVFFAALLGGLVGGQKFFVPPSVWGVGFALFTLGGWIAHQRGKRFQLNQPIHQAARVFLAAAFFCLGAARGAWENRPVALTHVRHFANQESEFRGIVTVLPEITATRTTVNVKILPSPQEGQPQVGNVLLIFFHSPPELVYGDEIRVSGTLVPILPDSGSSYDDYLDRNGFSALMRNPSVALIAHGKGDTLSALLYDIRAFLIKKIFNLYPAPENALMAGILVGDETKIPSAMERDFRRTGTAHIIAISGMNFSVLVWLLLALLRGVVRRWWAPLCLLPFLVFYTLLTGARPAILRAGIMCAMALVGRAIGRERSNIDTLFFTAAVMGIFQPKVLFDVGFQLSITATLGIFLFNPPILHAMNKLFFKMGMREERARTRWIGVFNELIITSLSAQILTVWIIAAVFHQFSWVSLLANMAIAPLQSIIMIGGFLSVIIASLTEPLGRVIALLVYPAPALTIQLVHFFAEFPWALSYTSLSTAAAWFMILFILGIYWRRGALFCRSKRTLFPIGLILLVFSTLLIWKRAADQSDHRTHILFRNGATQMRMEIITGAKREIVMGTGWSSYQAQDWLRSSPLFGVKKEGALIRFQEPWMGDHFLQACAGKKNCPRIGLSAGKVCLDQQCTPLQYGTLIQMDEVALRAVSQFLSRSGWMVRAGDVSVFVPQGISPVWIEKNHQQTEVASADFLIAGREDDAALWHDMLGRWAASAPCPPPMILSARELGDFEMFVDGSKVWVNRVKKGN